MEDTINDRVGDQGYSYSESPDQEDLMMYYTAKQMLNSNMSLETVLRCLSQTKESLQALANRFETVPEDKIFQ